MRSLARWSSLPLLAVPLSSWALSLGEIEANSYLNQPLNAEIPFSATDQELATLSVAMAPVALYAQSGIEYPAFLNTIGFEIGRNAAGENVILVSSRGAIAEPFVTMLVTVSHARGQTVKEYSVFLDPPLFRAADTAPEPVAPPATRDPEPPVARAPIERAAPAPQVAPASPPAPQQRTPSPSPSPSQVAPSQVAPPPSQPAPAPATGDYTVRSGDTLWGVASRYRPAGITMNQAMISIFDANPNAFDGNINRLRRGAILRMPPASQFAGVAAGAATAEVQRQIEAWRNQARAEPALVLLPPSESAAAGGGAADAGASARVDQLEDRVSDLESQLGSTEAELAEARRLLDIRDADLANLQRQLDQAADAAADDAVPAADVETAADAETAADVDELEQLFVDETDPDPDAAGDAVETEPEPEPETAVAEPPPVEPTRTVVARDTGPSIVDRALEWITNPIVAIGGGVLVVLLGALAFLRRRRDDVDDVTGQWEALEAELEDETDLTATARIRSKAREPDMVVVEGLRGEETAEERRLTGTTEIEALESDTDFDFGDAGTAEVESLHEPELADQTLSSQTVINLDQADPIAEADFHMAYGLYDQAADLISKALSADPDDRVLKLKLLEVYFVWGNKEQFLETARSLRADGGGADWDKVVIMGKQICPDDPLFAEATAAAGEVDLDLEGGGSSAGLDFPLEEDSDDDMDLDFGLIETGEQLSLEQSGAKRAPRRRPADDDMLDIGAQTQAGLEAALLDETDHAGERTMPGGDIGDLESTAESPTISTRTRRLSDELTLENATVENLAPDAPTVETPTIETRAADDAGDTAEHARPAAGDRTAEIEIDDLALDVGDLDDLPPGLGDEDDDGGTIERRGLEADDDMLSATGVAEVLDDQDLEHTGTAILGDQDATTKAPGFADDDDIESTGSSTAVLEQPAARFDPDPPSSEDDLDLNLDDFSIALEGGGDTVEHPISSRFSDDDFDFDIGTDVKADDEPTGTEEVALDPQTMTEVGTKLDLARAYIDMGDPEGARSILEEVLGEGDAAQRREAQALINALPA